MVLCSAPPHSPPQDPLGCRVLEGFLLLAAVGSCPALQKFDIPFLLEAQHVSLVDVVTANRSPAFLHLRDELGSARVCPAAAELDTPGQGLWKLREGWTARLRAPANERPIGGWLGGQWSLHIDYHVSGARRVVTGSCVLGVNGRWLYFGTQIPVLRERTLLVPWQVLRPDGTSPRWEGAGSQTRGGVLLWDLVAIPPVTERPKLAKSEAGNMLFPWSYLFVHLTCCT